MKKKIISIIEFLNNIELYKSGNNLDFVTQEELYMSLPL